MHEHELVQKKLKEEGKLFTGEEARQTLRRILQCLSEFKTNNVRRKRAHLRDTRNEESRHITPPSEMTVDTQYIDEDIQLSEEVDFELIDDTTDEDADDYETFQLPRKQ
ncbi:hypothetical protein D3C77_640670 [compost metagenome]